jgi:hypothetical protein
MSEEPWTAAERRVLDRLRTPVAIQAFLDRTPYSTDDAPRCPRRVLAERRAHCLDGAVFGAAALRRLGHRPLLVDLEAVRDDDHVLAVYRVGGGWGAVAKSNCSGLRFREPVFRTLRELAMSYFELYFNTLGEKTLRRFSLPVDLSRFDRMRWEVDDAALDPLQDALISARHARLITPAQARRLVKTDRLSFRAGFLGANWRGLYKP